MITRLWQAYALHELGEMYMDAQQRQIGEHYLEKALKLYDANHARAEADQVERLLTERNSRLVDA